jgi:hypothetical protein
VPRKRREGFPEHRCHHCYVGRYGRSARQGDRSPESGKRDPAPISRGAAVSMPAFRKMVRSLPPFPSLNHNRDGFVFVQVIDLYQGQKTLAAKKSGDEPNCGSEIPVA